MSLATFKKKSINSVSSATKRSGKPTNNYWIYQGSYGRKGNLPSIIFNASLMGPNGNVGGNYYNGSNSGFSITVYLDIRSFAIISSISSLLKYTK